MRIPGAFGPREGVSMGIHSAASGKWPDLPERAQGFKERKKYLAANLCLTKLLTVNIETKGNHTLLESEVNSKRELTEYLKDLGATSILPIVITF